MTLFKKKVDPISDRKRALTAEIAALEVKIQKLGAQVSQPQSHPRLRPAAMPHHATVSTHAEEVGRVSPCAPGIESGKDGARGATRSTLKVPTEPVFEEVDQNKLKAKSETITTPNHYNDLGVRKYDFNAFVQRIKNHFNPPPASDPRLLTYLAAGSFQGLRPLRYEKRVARNRFIVLITFFFLTLLGILLVFLKNH